MIPRQSKLADFFFPSLPHNERYMLEPNENIATCIVQSGLICFGLQKSPEITRPITEPIPTQ